MACEHKHLIFEDNSPLHIKCVDCDRYWTGVTHKGGMFDYTLMGADPIIDNSRHSKFETARTEPVRRCKGCVAGCSECRPHFRDGAHKDS